MSIEQLELILSDTYQMDVSFPTIFGHRKEFMQSSYSIDELSKTFTGCRTGY